MILVEQFKLQEKQKKISIVIRGDFLPIARPYRTIRVPEALVTSVLTLIEEQKELGYRSHSEFIIEAIRRRIEELLKLKQKGSE